MSGRWRNFNDSELAQVGVVLPSLGSRAPAQVCPSCGRKTLKWYHYRNPYRVNSKVSYVWCSSCLKYYGQTTFQKTWDLPDPLALPNDQRRLRESDDLSVFFSALDHLWETGELPQVRGDEASR